MKKLLLIIATFSTLTISAQTSVYHPFPESNACWNIQYVLSQCWMGTSDENYSIIISGDTNINSLNYHKLTTPYVQFYTYGSCTQQNFPGYKGAIRQDTANRKVFFVPPSDSAEQLLYDFTMQVGDTVKGYTQNFILTSVPDIVLSVDSVLVGNDFHKRWKINAEYLIYLIEGVGSTFGLIEPSPGSAIDVPGYHILCFQQNGMTLFPDTTDNCQIITSINSNEAKSDQIKVFPNPSNGLFTVEFDQPVNISEVQVADMLGNIVYQENTNNKKQIHIDNLPSGIYILTVIDKDKKKINKKIVCSL